MIWFGVGGSVAAFFIGVSWLSHLVGSEGNFIGRWVQTGTVKKKRRKG